jgi:predicted ATP-binding protein involved in virulence
MFLKRIKLTNVRSIKELELSFDAPNSSPDDDRRTRNWTIILGENGTGKSTLLRAIALITAGSEALKELLPEPDAWIRQGEQECSIEADLVTARGEIRSVALVLSRGQHFKDVYGSNQLYLDKLDSALEHTDRSYFTVGYGASRRLANPRFSTLPPQIFHQARASNVATLFSFDAVLNSLENWAMDLDYRTGERGLAVVAKTMNDLLPNLTFSRVDKEKRRLMFNTVDGELPLSQLSDGYQSMAGWCGDLLYRITETYKDYTDPLKARGVLLVDELDLHLHPVWQRSLKEFLTRQMPNFQVIATTHSILTAHQAGQDELYFLNRSAADQSSVLHRYDGAPNKLYAHQLLMSPAFGLNSINSKEVDDMRVEYDQLSSQDALSPQDEEKLESLKLELEDVPEWSRNTELEEKQYDVLSRIANVLEKEKTS